jgi:hypothetical protein
VIGENLYTIEGEDLFTCEGEDLFTPCNYRRVTISNCNYKDYRTSCGERTSYRK